MKATTSSFNLAAKVPILIVVGAATFLAILKWESIGLPHYWDEAFPYSYAIGHMTENGPSISPGAAPTEYTTGHPLLYYFIQSSWNSVVGTNMTLQRLLPLMISIACLFMTYFSGRRLFNSWVGAGAAVLLAGQNTFLAQATFQLPETLLTFLMLATLYCYLAKRRVLFVVAASLLLFTKEPAIVLLGMIFIYDLFLERSEPLKYKLRQAWVFAIPVGLNLTFYLTQYLIHGWFFFPRHTGFMVFGQAFFNQLEGYFSYLFIYHGRNGLFFTAVILTLVLVFRQWKRIQWSAPIRHALLLFIMIGGYLLFSAANFFSNRYILCLFPLFMMLTAATIYFGIRHQIIRIIGVVILVGVTTFYSFRNRKDSDHSLGYASAVRTQLAAVQYCVDQGWQDQTIHAGFLMSKNLISSYPRYLTKAEIFPKVHAVFPEDCSVRIISSNEKDLHHLRDNDQFQMVKRFEENRAWCEVYVLR